MSAGAISSAISALGRNGSGAGSVDGNSANAPRASLMAAPAASPMKIHFPPAAPAVVARNTSAHAVPSGYGSSSAERTMSSRRSGTIAAMPSSPPSSARIATCQNGGVIPQRNSAGMVKIVPVASDELAEPMVCEMFASRITSRRRISRNSATVSTAMGIEVETVSPTRSPRYAFAAPKSRPKTIPATTARAVNAVTDSREGIEALLFEVVIEREGGAQAAAAHHFEGGAVDEAQFAAIEVENGGECRFVDFSVNPNDFDERNELRSKATNSVKTKALLSEADELRQRIARSQ